MLPFTQNQTTGAASPPPRDSAISSWFTGAEEAAPPPGLEEGRGLSKASSNNQRNGFLSHCSERWNLSTSQNPAGEQLEGEKDSETRLGRRTGSEREVFTPKIGDPRPSPTFVACLGSQHRPEREHGAKNDPMPPNLVLGDDTESAGMQAMTAGEEAERSPGDEADAGRLRPVPPLIEEPRGADGETFVGKADSAEGGKDQSAMPPEDTDECERIGKYAFSAEL